MKIDEKKYKEIQMRYNRVKKYKADPTAAILMGRPVLESLLKLIYEIEFKKEYLGSLDELIAFLENNQILVGELEKKATRLRRTGNFANHRSDGEVPETYSKEYVKDLEYIFNWFSSRYYLFTEAFSEDSLSEIVKFGDLKIPLKDIQNLTPTLISAPNLYDNLGNGVLPYEEAISRLIINQDGTSEVFMKPDIAMLITNKNLLVNKHELMEGQHITEYDNGYTIIGTSSIVIYGNLAHLIKGIGFTNEFTTSYIMIETSEKTYYLEPEKRHIIKLFLHLNGLYSQIKKKIEEYFTKKDCFTSEEFELSLAAELGGWFSKKIYKSPSELTEKENKEETDAALNFLYPGRDFQTEKLNSEEIEKIQNDLLDYHYDKGKEEVDYLWKFYKYYNTSETISYRPVHSFDDILIIFEEDEIITRREGRWYKY